MTALQSSLKSIFEHNLWANDRLLTFCQTLTDAQLDSTVIGVYGSIRDTVRHVVLAERNYLARIATGERASEAPASWSMAELLAQARTSGAALAEWAERVSVAHTFNVKWKDEQTVDIPMIVLLIQSINHATEHRAQIATMITQLGLIPPEMDAWTYFATLRGLPE